ncbi:MAG: DNA-3-methyladenine glycosylase 2 family protein [Beijerinckiaceae bacterium]|nr:DNA-3-methyladenine glycosylase 2 family protein [Beijerinckiaceae bacterium]
MAGIVDLAGTLPLRRREPGLEGLLSIIVSQQLSVASARAIWAKVKDRLAPFDAGRLAILHDDDFRICGLSAPKIRTIRSIADAVGSGALDLNALGAMTADEAHAAMVTVKGIGPWTADVYLMFCLGYADAFAAGDLALQEAVRIGYGFEARPSVKELVEHAERWRPWRSVAARALWAYYNVVKSRAGIGA